MSDVRMLPSGRFSAGHEEYRLRETESAFEVVHEPDDVVIGCFVLEGEGKHQSVRLLPDARDPKTTRAIAELMAQPRGLFPLQ